MLNSIKDACIHQLIEAQVGQSPNAVAAVFQGKQITYEQLNHKANQLAHYLRTLGVKPDTLVGVCVERSLEMLVALLGVLKAGGAYVPLDPSYPTERLGFMLEDSQLPVLIAQKHLLDSLPISKRIQVVCLDENCQDIAQLNKEDFDSGVTAENLAYTIYTSGSTGKPKGVQITHGAVVNFLNSMRQEPGLTHQDVMLAVTTISFDIAILELYLPLIVGAKIVLVSREIASDGVQLANALDQSRATVMQATPANWRLLLTAGWQGNKQLKMLCGGEAITRSLANQLLEKGNSLWNMYGPTETTVWSAIHRVEFGYEPIPIGHAIANTQIYLLEKPARRKNDKPKLVPIGTPGEIYIGGDSVARGYLNRPELNRERFIRDTFSEKPGKYLYKTGDLARYLPDGTIEFIGRVDYQVKIRGFRVELGDIEALLSQHSNVRETAVIAKDDSSGHKRLIAYVTPKVPSHSQSSTFDKSFLADHISSSQIFQWQKIWNMAYSQPLNTQEPTFNINGWINSYTDLPISNTEMRDWLTHTVERILSRRPQHVLEIGCGTGMIMFQIAPHCSSYYGLDISDKAIHYIQHQLQNRLENWAHVNLKQGAAHQLDELVPNHFDTVIINSVIQYFPNVNYLVSVLEKVVKLVRPGGRIFIDDIRNLTLLETFHTSVQFRRAADEVTLSELRQKIKEKMFQDKELVIHPDFFIALKEHLPEITQIEMAMKRGWQQNELDKFRYDVILHIGSEAQPAYGFMRLDWQQHQLTLSDIRNLLLKPETRTLKVTGIPNARIFEELQVVELLQNPENLTTVGDLRTILRQTSPTSGIHPEELWHLAQSCPDACIALWFGLKNAHYYDVFFSKRDSSIDIAIAEIEALPDKEALSKNWSAYANNPFQLDEQANLITQLRDFLKEKLPDYMVPSVFIIMDKMPLTPNGKVDRRALPESEKIRPALKAEFVAPRNPIEQQLAAIWSRLLQIEQVGIYDNFFEMGGHSLLTVQLLAQVREVIKVDIPLFYFFKEPTISGLIKAVDIISQQEYPGVPHNLLGLDNWKFEATLDPEIHPKIPFADLISESQGIFLTGATGFLGAFLLYELLQQTQAKIYCLVRASSLKEGKYRLQANLKRYLLWNEELSFRIIPVLGDLTRPNLGLTLQQFRELAVQVNLIYHCGAQINLAYPYTALRDSNVFGTQEVLRLAVQDVPIPVHFVSTLDVFQSPEYMQAKAILEDDQLEDDVELHGGYAQTKWVAEKILMTARSRGIPVNIYRPEMISGHSETGVVQTNDLLCRFLKGMIQLGAAPIIDQMIHMVPVNYVSKAIVNLSMQRESLNKTFHLTNPNPLHLDEFICEIRQLGYSIQQIPYQQWLTALLKDRALQENELNPLIPLLTEQLGRLPSYLEISLLTSQKFDCKNSIEGLHGTSIVCPPVNSMLLKTYFSYLNSCDFIIFPPAKCPNT